MDTRTWAEKTGKWFEKKLLLFIVLSIAGGILLGFTLPGTAQSLRRYINFTLYLMLYPMMVGIQIEKVAQAAREIKAISFSFVFNFVLSPLLGWALAMLFLRQYPDFAAGLILLAATPCAGMVVGWTGLARGNVPLALVIVVVSLLLSILTIPVTMLVLAGALVHIDITGMLKGTLAVILAPLLAGDITRRLILARWGPDGFQAIRPLLPPLSMLGMFGIILISVANGAPRITSDWSGMLMAAPALAGFYLLQMVAAMTASRRIGFKPGDVIALTNAVAGKNISLALGLAVHFFSPVTAAMLAVNPLFQAPVMAWFYRWSVRLQTVKTVQGAASGTGGKRGDNVRPVKQIGTGTRGK
ncbi:MAG: bile acid:sodium symporter [Bacillota bacterium]